MFLNEKAASPKWLDALYRRAYLVMVVRPSTVPSGVSPIGSPSAPLEKSKTGNLRPISAFHKHLPDHDLIGRIISRLASA